MVTTFFISILVVVVVVVVVIVFVVVVVVVVVVIDVVVVVVVFVDGFGLRGVEVDLIFDFFVLFHSEVIHDSCFGWFCSHQNFTEQF